MLKMTIHPSIINCIALHGDQQKNGNASRLFEQSEEPEVIENQGACEREPDLSRAARAVTRGAVV